jgi:Zn-dependent protease
LAIRFAARSSMTTELVSPHEPRQLSPAPANGWGFADSAARGTGPPHPRHETQRGQDRQDADREQRSGGPGQELEFEDLNAWLADKDDAERRRDHAQEPVPAVRGAPRVLDLGPPAPHGVASAAAVVASCVEVMGSGAPGRRGADEESPALHETIATRASRRSALEITAIRAETAPNRPRPRSERPRRSGDGRATRAREPNEQTGHPRTTSPTFPAPDALLRCADGGQRVACARAAGPAPSAVKPVPPSTWTDRLRRVLGACSIAVASHAVLPPAPLAADGSIEILSLVLTIVLLVFSLGIHEAAHAWVALQCGDPTARDLGRITLNPIPHIDLWMTILLPALIYYSSGGQYLFGGAKPVPVDFRRLRHPLRDMSIVAVAGPLSNLLLVGFFLVLLKFFVTTGYYNGSAAFPSERNHDLLPKVMLQAVSFNALLFVFNLIPVPPLDGSRIMTWLLPPSLRQPYNSIGIFGLIAVFLLLRWEPFARVVWNAMGLVVRSAEQVVSLGGRW